MAFVNISIQTVVSHETKKKQHACTVLELLLLKVTCYILPLTLKQLYILQLHIT